MEIISGCAIGVAYWGSHYSGANYPVLSISNSFTNGVSTCQIVGKFKCNTTNSYFSRKSFEILDKKPLMKETKHPKKYDDLREKIILISKFLLIS